MNWLSNFVLRRAGIIVIVGVLLSVAAGYYSVLLYKNLRTEIHELLPTTARSVIDLYEVTHRLESIESLGVLVFSQHPQDSKRFVIDLAEKLSHVPKDVIASVEYRIDRELRFFKERQALYMDLADLILVRDYIRNKLNYEKELYNPLTIFREQELPEPTLDLEGLKRKYQGKTSSYDRFPGGFYATPDETKRVLLVNIPGESSGIQGNLRLKTAVEKAVTELKPKSYAPDLEVKFTGGVEDAIEEQSALVADLELSTGIVTLIVTVAMLLFFRSIRATLALILSLFMGTLWTFGVSYFLVGYLNANSAFLGSIVLGNGINFGIIFLARYLEERRRNKGDAYATRTAMKHTATSTWTAALAAGLSYGSLILTGFRGFKQFGVIGFVGMVLCWISAFTVLPALLTLFDRFGPMVNKKKPPPRPYLAGFIASCVGRFPKTIWGLSFIASVMSVATLFQYTPQILETDLSKLRNKESMTHGSSYLSKHLDEIFQRYLSPLVILPRSRENAGEIAKLLKEKKKMEGKQSLIASVQTLEDFLPTQVEQKIAILKQIRNLLPPKLLHRLSESDQRTVSEFLNEAVMKPLQEKDFPPLLLRKFTEKDGSIGKLVIVEPPLNNATWQGDNLIRFIDELREAADSVEPGSPVAGSNAIASDMIRAISHDGPRATLFAFIAVIVLVIFLFRNVKTIALVLFSLFIGVLWLAGLILGFDLKINFLNFIALPITFGIGVDYGVNIFQRYRTIRTGNILDVIRNTGSAVGLCSFTTIIGYMSLLIAGNQGFVSFGLLAVAGEMTCVIVAVISLPAFLSLRNRQK